MVEEIYPNLPVLLNRNGWYIVSSILYFHFDLLCKTLKKIILQIEFKGIYLRIYEMMKTKTRV